MKILKVRPNIPDPMTYLEVIKEYQHWDEITSFASREESIEIRNNDVFFMDSNRGSHTDMCQLCTDQQDKSCDVVITENKLLDERYKKTNEQIATVKRCPALIDLFKTGVVIPAWTDMWFESAMVDNDPNKVTLIAMDSNNKPICTMHSAPQIDLIKMNFDVTHNHTVKFILPYRIFSTEYIIHKSLFWLGELPFRVVEGIQDTNGLTSINLNTIWNLPLGERWEVKKGTPLFHIMEVPRNSIGAKHDIVQYEDLDWDRLKELDIKDRQVKSLGGYRKNQNNMI